jgi:hypothetical protein
VTEVPPDCGRRPRIAGGNPYLGPRFGNKFEGTLDKSLFI